MSDYTADFRDFMDDNPSAVAICLNPEDTSLARYEFSVNQGGRTFRLQLSCATHQSMIDATFYDAAMRLKLIIERWRNQ